MRALLDTHILLWALATPDRLPDGLRRHIADKRNEILFSAASIWDIAVKSGLGRADFQADPRLVLDSATASGLVELPVTASATLLVASLPPLHKDPFDRLLVAQALSEPAVLFTADSRLTDYAPDLIRRVRGT
jgi:PIN domain nuclease of toxin-antitoxin system